MTFIIACSFAVNKVENAIFNNPIQNLEIKDSNITSLQNFKAKLGFKTTYL